MLDMQINITAQQYLLSLQKTLFVFKISFISDSKCCVLQKITSDGLLGALFNIQSAMLVFMELNEDSSIIQQTHVKVFVRR